MSNKNIEKTEINDKISSLSIPKKEYFRGKLKEIIPSTIEREKIFPLGFMFFCILFNYTILRDTKDVLMVTAPKSGAEVIPFIKTYVNLPMAISFTAIYTQLCDKLEQKNVFYICTIPFLVFFGIFANIIYPNNQLLHPHRLIDNFASYLPSGFVAPLSVVRNWSFALFYVMAEMWGSVVLSLLFWGLANEVTTVNEARKYYQIFQQVLMHGVYLLNISWALLLYLVVL
jgi:AAA family ATP:ADP antiporter